MTHFYKNFALSVCLALLLIPAAEADCGKSTVEKEAQVENFPIEKLKAEVASGDQFIQNELGRRYGLGKDVPKDSERSFAFYELSATQGYCEAQTNLGFMYMNGEGVTKDLEKAKHWYTLAAKQGNSRAAYSLGYIAVTFERNGEVAEKWLIVAAEAGYLPAQRALINLYQSGDILPRDVYAAVRWIHRVRDANLYGKVWRKE